MALNKRILITGGAGFLGSHLSEKLLDSGNEVFCLDNFITGNVKNVEHLLDHRYFHLIEHDVCVPIQLDIDCIYNLACPASPVHYQSDPVKTIKTNVHGAINMLELALLNDCRILQASTSEVYGDPHIHPQKEDYWGNVNPIGIRSCYDEGKRCAETLFFDFHRQYGFPIKVARIFNTYGPRMHPNDGRVVSNFIIQALKNEPITIYGQGAQTRSFCYVDDLIEALIRLMDSAESFLGPVNLGNPNEFSILELAHLVIDLTQSSSDIIFCPLPSDDPQQRKPDIDLAYKELKWKPQIELREGILKTVDFFRNSECFQKQR